VTLTVEYVGRTGTGAVVDAGSSATVISILRYAPRPAKMMLLNQLLMALTQADKKECAPTTVHELNTGPCQNNVNNTKVSVVNRQQKWVRKLRTKPSV
jgi:hypothetical protein